MMYNDCEKVCLYLPIYVKTELFRPRNPYDTDLPVISDARELFVFLLFSFFFGLESGLFLGGLLLLVVVGILIRDV